MKMKLKVAILISSLLAGSLVWAQLPRVDEFEEENQKRVIERQRLKEKTEQSYKKEGIKYNNVIVADEPAGSTGVKIIKESYNEASKIPLVNKLSYSSIKSYVAKNKPMVSSVVTYHENKEHIYDVANSLSVDPGYIADPFWMQQDEVLVMKSGRYDYYGSFYLYAFDKKNQRLFRVIPHSIANRKILLSPSRRFMTYIVGGGPYGVDTTTEDSKGLSLWVWDALENKTMQVGQSDWLQGSYCWSSNNELLYRTCLQLF